MFKKRNSILIFLTLICILALPLAANASTVPITPMASLYISSTSVTLDSVGNGRVLLGNAIRGTGIMDQIGVKTIELQTLKNGSWQTAYTIVNNDYLYNSGSYYYDCYYTVTPGNQYRSYVEFYVADNGGSETKIVTSSPVIAQ